MFLYVHNTVHIYILKELDLIYSAKTTQLNKKITTQLFGVQPVNVTENKTLWGEENAPFCPCPGPESAEQKTAVSWWVFNSNEERTTTSIYYKQV